jgi:AraC-like DNA-binding protein
LTKQAKNSIIPSFMKQLGANSFFSIPDFPLVCMRQERHAATELHTHDFHELVVILGGRGMHLMDGHYYPIEAGDVFLIRGDMAHGYAETNAMALVNILFEPQRLRLPLAGLADVPGYHALFRVEPQLRQADQFRRRLRLLPQALDEVALMIEKLEAELEGGALGYRFVSVALLMELIGFLARNYFAAVRREQRPLRKLSEVMSYIEAHYAEPITIADLTRIAGASESTLTRQFHKVVGRSPIEHVLRVRVERAAGLIRRSDLRITEIAYECGFSDGNYLARQFVRIMGVSPSEYRRQNRTG